MSVDPYTSQGYITGNQNTTAAMPTSQMSIHGIYRDTYPLSKQKMTAANSDSF